MGYQVHPLWQTQLLPALFLLTAICMGFSVVILEATLAAVGFGRDIFDDLELLSKIGRIIAGILFVYLGLRFGDLAWRGDLPRVFDSGLLSVMFWIEIALFAYPAITLSFSSRRRRLSKLFPAAASMLAGAVLYRIDAFLVAYQTRLNLALLPVSAGDPGHDRRHLDRGAGLRLLRQDLPHSARPAGWPRPLTDARIQGDLKVSTRITIDPVTRIEGHLRVDCEINGGKVTKAWSSGQMWRGVELILLGRDPRDAWTITQRICGVCTTVHAIASVRAVEDALKLEVPLNAQYHPQYDRGRARDP